MFSLGIPIPISTSGQTGTHCTCCPIVVSNKSSRTCPPLKRTSWPSRQELIPNLIESSAWKGARSAVITLSLLLNCQSRSFLDSSCTNSTPSAYANLTIVPNVKFCFPCPTAVISVRSKSALSANFCWFQPRSLRISWTFCPKLCRCSCSGTGALAIPTNLRPSSTAS